MAKQGPVEGWGGCTMPPAKPTGREDTTFVALHSMTDTGMDDWRHLPFFTTR